MIYKIQNSNLTNALKSGAKILVFSFDGQFILVKSDTIIEYAMESYNESSETELFKDALYKQPCKGC